MELKFKPGNFALHRSTLETMIVLDTNEEENTLLLLCPKTQTEKWYPQSNYNLFVRDGDKWIVEGPPIQFTHEQLMEMKNISNKNNISERFR